MPMTHASRKHNRQPAFYFDLERRVIVNEDQILYFESRQCVINNSPFDKAISDQQAANNNTLHSPDEYNNFQDYFQA
jgi:hypothetical protein